MASNEVVSGLSPFSEPRSFQAKISSKRKRTYIMPTGFGTAFGGMVFVLFFMAAGYANNLIFIFFFMLISIGFTAMLLTNRNVNEVELIGLRSSPLFAQESGNVSVQLRNRSRLAAMELEIFFAKMNLPVSAFSIDPQTHAVVDVPYMNLVRGLHTLPVLTLQSRFPFGLLRAWSPWRSLGAQVLIYPARKGVKEFPQLQGEGGSLQNAGTFRDHRLFQTGDSVRRIDWKASARRREILVKNYEEPEKPTLHFHWEQTSHLADFEQRLSQLALWIDQAEQQQFRYALSFGPTQISASRGKEHWGHCLEALALTREEGLS